MNQKPKKLHTISEEDETSVVTEALKSEDRGKPPVSGGDAKEYAEALKKIVALLGSKDFEQFKTMKKSIREINYYYRISNVKKNLLLASEEYKTYTENYENILGEEAAFMID
jgi:hypothetical protein